MWKINSPVFTLLKSGMHYFSSRILTGLKATTRRLASPFRFV
ncbi:hypothetical protein SAMN05444415_102140 [Salipiger profundus]|jgi:hypothetical protein|nr:hypothetical protein SAMN05444415_102140 [Salipiger profundus]